MFKYFESGRRPEEDYYEKTSMIAFVLAAVMGLSVSAFAQEKTTGAKADTQIKTQDDSKKAKSEHLVAEEFKDIVTLIFS